MGATLGTDFFKSSCSTWNGIWIHGFTENFTSVFVLIKGEIWPTSTRGLGGEILRLAPADLVSLVTDSRVFIGFLARSLTEHLDNRCPSVVGKDTLFLENQGNEVRQRMSGNNINLKFEHQSMPLIVALHRWAGTPDLLPICQGIQ